MRRHEAITGHRTGQQHNLSTVGPEKEWKNGKKRGRKCARERDEEKKRENR